MQYIFNLRGIKSQVNFIHKSFRKKKQKKERNIESWINILLMNVQWRAHKKSFEGFL